jgi:CBS domain-containing protein
MKQEDVGVVPVVHPDGRLLGLVTDRDLVIRGLAGGHSLDNARAEALATTDIEVVSTRDPLSAVLELMGRQQIRRVPVIDEADRLVGIVAIADITRHADYHDDLQQALEKISGRRSFWSRIWR